MTIETISLLCTVVVIGSLCLVLYLMYCKLSLAIDRLGKQSISQNDNVIAQIESLLALYVEIRPAHGLPPTRGWAASPDFLLLLTRFVTEEHPVTVVECSSGISTLILAACLKNQGHGHVYSLEHDLEFATRTRRMIHLHGLETWATVIDAPLKELTLPNWHGEWYDTTGLPQGIAIDILVIDGPPAATSTLARYPAVPVLGKQLSPGSVVLLDDANREDERLIVSRWKKECPNFSDIPCSALAEKGVACLKA